jgi:glycerol-3-phosphate O-acyltransferase
MTGDVTLPIWVVVLLVATTLIALLDRLFMPGARWIVRRRVNRAIDEMGARLRISLRPFQLTKRQVLLDRLVYDAEVIATMQAYAREHGMPREVAQAKVVAYAREIVPAFNAYVYFRIGYWLAKKIARVLYTVRVGFLDPRRLQDVGSEATIVFVMNHRSNMDYILVSYLVARSSALSYAVGEWARVWPLQTLVRAMGAFFVRRNSKDPLYRKVLERYIHMATDEGVCQAVFPEGGLSHDGFLRAPKLGVLDYMLRNYDIERQRDIVFVPIGINYDRIIEDKSLLHRRDPNSPKRSRWFMYRTFFGFWRKNMALSLDERRKRFGYASVNFGRPLSLKAYCAENKLAFNRMERAERFAEIDRLAHGLMDRVAEVVPILPAPLVATVFLAAGDEPLDSFEVKRRVHDLIHTLQHNGAPIRNNEIPKERTIQRAVDMLRYRHMVVEDNGLYRLNPDTRELTEFYAHSIAHWAGRGDGVAGGELAQTDATPRVPKGV